ncbi:MAG: tRNA-dihydrouridine synthase family protein [Bacilli bacterium]
MSFFIGDVEIKNKVILAPMAGITSFSYRRFMKPFGASLTYTEMISDCALINGTKETYKLLSSNGEDRPLAVQLFGGSKETLLKAIDVLENTNCQYDILDLNLACPVPKVTKNNGGSSWLKDQNKLFDMVSAVVKRSKKPVSCKIRLGYDVVNINETVKTLEKAGVKFIAIHARTKLQLYTGLPDFNVLKDIHNIIKIPFCVSGNIYTVADALNALEITKADAIMVARGAVGNPELLTNINKALNKGSYSEEKDFNRQKEYALTYADNMLNEFKEEVGVRMLRGILPKFFDGIPGSKPLKNELATNTRNKDDIINIINKFSDLENKSKEN